MADIDLIPTEDKRGSAENARKLEAYARKMAESDPDWASEVNYWQAEAERREQAEATA